MFMSLGVLYPMFLSVSFFNYTLVGLLPADIGSTITWMSWFSSSWVWDCGNHWRIFCHTVLYSSEQVEMGHGYIKDNKKQWTYEEAGKNSLDYTGCFIDLVDDRESMVSALVALAALCLMLIQNN